MKSLRNLQIPQKLETTAETVEKTRQKRLQNSDQSCKCGKLLWGASFTAKASSTCNRNFSSNTALNEQGPLKINRNGLVESLMVLGLAEYLHAYLDVYFDVSCSELFWVVLSSSWYSQTLKSAHLQMFRCFAQAEFHLFPLPFLGFLGFPGVPCVSGAGSVDALTSGVIFILSWWVDPLGKCPGPGWTLGPSGNLAPRWWHWWAESAAAWQSLADRERMRAEVDESRCTIVERDNNNNHNNRKNENKNFKKMTIRIIYT